MNITSEALALRISSKMWNRVHSMATNPTRVKTSVFTEIWICANEAGEYGCD